MYPRIHPVPEPNRRLLRALREPQLPSPDSSTDRPMQPDTLRPWNQMQRARRERHLQMPGRLLSQPRHHHWLQARVREGPRLQDGIPVQVRSVS